MSQTEELPMFRPLAEMDEIHNWGQADGPSHEQINVACGSTALHSLHKQTTDYTNQGPSPQRARNMAGDRVLHLALEPHLQSSWEKFSSHESWQSWFYMILVMTFKFWCFEKCTLYRWAHFCGDIIFYIRVSSGCPIPHPAQIPRPCSDMLCTEPWVCSDKSHT